MQTRGVEKYENFVDVIYGWSLVPLLAGEEPRLADETFRARCHPLAAVLRADMLYEAVEGDHLDAPPIDAWHLPPVFHSLFLEE